MSNLELLNSYLKVFKELNPLDCIVMIADNNGVILNFVNADKFELKAEIGNKVPEESALTECLATGKVVHKTLTSKAYGVPVKSIATPIFEGGKIIGAIASGTSLDSQETLQNVIQNVAATSEEITATSEEILNSAISLAKDLEELKSHL